MQFHTLRAYRLMLNGNFIVITLHIRMSHRFHGFDYSFRFFRCAHFQLNSIGNPENVYGISIDTFRSIPNCRLKCIQIVVAIVMSIQFYMYDVRICVSLRWSSLIEFSTAPSHTPFKCATMLHKYSLTCVHTVQVNNGTQNVDIHSIHGWRQRKWIFHIDNNGFDVKDISKKRFANTEDQIHYLSNIKH